MGISGGVASELAEALSHAPAGLAIQWPIELTPKSPFRVGTAALVFASPNVLSPADDLAVFGIYPVPVPPEADEWAQNQHGPPLEGAQVVAWFRPPEVNRTYDIDFSCVGSPGFEFVLDTGDGAPETQHVPGEVDLRSTTVVQISKDVSPSTHDWLSFRLSSGEYWELSSCKITMLP